MGGMFTWTGIEVDVERAGRSRGEREGRRGGVGRRKKGRAFVHRFTRWRRAMKREFIMRMCKNVHVERGGVGIWM